LTFRSGSIAADGAVTIDPTARQALLLWASRLEACLDGKEPTGAYVLEFPSAATAT
jgi:hypothetical protein